MIRTKKYKTVTKFVKVMPRTLWPLFFPDTVYSIHTGLSLKVTANIAGASCAAGELSMNSKCYRKFHNSSSLTWWRPLTWYDASNECLSHGGSLAVFTDIGRPSDNRQLTDWLTTSGTNKTYWIGLVKSWWKTTNEGW